MCVLSYYLNGSVVGLFCFVKVAINRTVFHFSHIWRFFFYNFSYLLCKTYKIAEFGRRKHNISHAFWLAWFEPYVIWSGPSWSQIMFKYINKKLLGGQPKLCAGLLISNSWYLLACSPTLGSVFLSNQVRESMTLFWFLTVVAMLRFELKNAAGIYNIHAVFVLLVLSKTL